MTPELKKRVMKFAGKNRDTDRLNNPCLTVRECILIANYIADLEKEIDRITKSSRKKDTFNGCSTGGW